MSLPERRTGTDVITPRWDPFRELEEFRARMDELFTSPFGTNGGLLSWEPPVDIEETEDSFLVEADLPGVKRDDVEVELLDNHLEIRGEAKEKERVGILRRRTRRTGQFHYRVSLPGEVDDAKVEARLEDSVLRLEIPKAASSRRRRIEVKGS